MEATERSMSSSPDYLVIGENDAWPSFETSPSKLMAVIEEVAAGTINPLSPGETTEAYLPRPLEAGDGKVNDLQRITTNWDSNLA